MPAALVGHAHAWLGTVIGRNRRRCIVADDLIDRDEACALLEVDAERLDATVEQGMLDRVGSDEDPRFSRAEVVALRELGG